MTARQIMRVSEKIVNEAIIDGRLPKKSEMGDCTYTDFTHISFISYCEGYDKALRDADKVVRNFRKVSHMK